MVFGEYYSEDYAVMCSSETYDCEYCSGDLERHGQIVTLSVVNAETEQMVIDDCSMRMITREVITKRVSMFQIDVARLLDVVYLLTAMTFVRSSKKKGNI
jgi:hypothetical protein